MKLIQINGPAQIWWGANLIASNNPRKAYRVVAEVSPKSGVLMHNGLEVNAPNSPLPRGISEQVLTWGRQPNVTHHEVIVVKVVNEADGNTYIFEVALWGHNEGNGCATIEGEKWRMTYPEPLQAQAKAS